MSGRPPAAESDLAARSGRAARKALWTALWTALWASAATPSGEARRPEASACGWVGSEGDQTSVPGAEAAIEGAIEGSVAGAIAGGTEGAKVW